MQRESALSETAAEFLTERRDFLYVHVVPSVGGSGWDVVLRVDGTYSDRSEAEGVAAMLRDHRSMSDVPMVGRTWWHGPPWESDR